MSSLLPVSAVAIAALAFLTPLHAAECCSLSPARQSAEHVRRGDRLMQQSRETPLPNLYRAARDYYQFALALDPQSTSAMLGLAWVANSEHRFTEGAQWCEKALALDEDLPWAYALLADGAVELGEYDRALDWCQRALDLKPDLASYSRAGHLLWLMGQQEKALALMAAAISAGGPRAENTAWCEAQLALMLFQTGRTTDAAQRLDAALLRSPRNVHLLTASMRVTAASGKIDDAIELGRRAIAVSPTHEALALLVDLYSLSGRTEEAEHERADLLEFHASGAAHHNPVDLDADSAHHDHPHPHAEHDDHDASHAHADKPAHDASPHAHGNTQLARFLADHQIDLEKALAEAESAWKTAPNIDAADTLAWCYHRLGRQAEAAAMMQHAKKWGTPNPELHFHAGLIHASLGETATARAELERALALNPEFHPRFAAQARETLATLAGALP